MTTNLLIAGFGGQGVMTIGKMIGECAFAQGLSVTFLPSYGPEQRGGTANCTVVLSDGPIGSPAAETLDVLCALNQPSLDKFLPSLKQGGTLMVNSDMVDVSGAGRPDIRIIRIPADSMALEIGSSKTANVIIFAVYMAASKIIPLDRAKEIALEKLAKKPQFMAMNNAAFDRGAALAATAI
jgi:2-oxoglutarate ferredoxin oxidoreductase subunit gamma